MAFTFCTNCGNRIEDGVEKCPYCGHIKGSERNYTYGQADGSQGYAPNAQNQAQNQDSGEQKGYNYGQNPYSQNQNPNQGQPGGFGSQGNNGQRQYNPYGMPPPNGFYRPVQDRPMSAGLLIFSIINIVFGCCCSVGFVFGIIALVYTLNARQAPTDEEEIRRKKIALAMNITAVILTVAFIAAFAVSFANGLTALI